ncbi:MAG: STAS domain-containing protein [Candidatus Muirbacterium halophilum]|nr:STAS domain-containing protein [Candidatus Muirbacterium halophilum]MCK9475836.1 STAS domain-containing protein [Candidatus Muirbacterium halophilum]
MEKDERIIIKTPKDFNFLNVKEFRENTKHICSFSSKIIYLDFKITENIDSSAIGEIINLCNKARKNKSRVVLINVGNQLLKVLNFIRLNKVVPIFSDERFAYECENELLNYVEHSDLNLVLIHNDEFILELFRHTLDSYGYFSVFTYKNIEDFLKDMNDEDNRILVLSSKELSFSEKMDLEKIRLENTGVILTDVYNILKEDNYGIEELLPALKELFRLIDECSQKNYELMESLKNDNKKEKVEYFKEYISEVLHDISSPLNVFLNTKAMFHDIEDNHPDLFNAFEASFDKISLLIEEMKMFIDKEDEIKFEKIELISIYNDLMALGKKICEFEGKQFYAEFSDSVTGKFINSSKYHLNHLFINLITNAAKYSKNKVGIEFHANGDEVEIRFFDNGFSVDNAMFFSPEGLNYRNIKKTFKKGSGRGLKIIGKIIDTLNYRICVENNEKGKYIKLFIPIIK